MLEDNMSLSEPVVPEVAPDPFASVVTNKVKDIVSDNNSADEEFQQQEEDRFTRLNDVFNVLKREDSEIAITRESGGRTDRNGVHTGWDKLYSLNVDGKGYSLRLKTISQSEIGLLVEEYNELRNDWKAVGVALLDRQEEFRGVEYDKRFGKLENLDPKKARIIAIERTSAAEISFSSTDQVGFSVKFRMNGDVVVSVRDSNDHYLTEFPEKIEAKLDLFGEIETLKRRMNEVRKRSRR